MASSSLPATGYAAGVAVVILNWNGRHWLEQFLPSVLAHSDAARIVVADNASTDDSVAWLRAQYPQVAVVQLADNLGFCQGYNASLDEVRWLKNPHNPHRTDAAEAFFSYEYYVLLNSDVEVAPDWLRPQLQLLAERPAVAAVQPKIRAYHAKTEFEYAGAAGGYLDRLGYPFCRGRLFDTLETDQGQYDDARPVAWATGACMLVRARVWHALQGLEPAFFAHMEEIDLCWRLWNAGHEVWYQGGSTVYHVGGGTLHKSNPRKTYLNFRNGLALLYKNLAPGELGPTLLQRTVLDLVAAAQLLAKGQTGDFRAVLRAHWHFWQRLSYWRQRRTLAQPHLRATERPGTYNGSLVWAYFAQGKRRFSELLP